METLRSAGSGLVLGFIAWDMVSEHHLWNKLLADINRQLEAKNIIMSEGRISYAYGCRSTVLS
ncbi:MAG: hypothetical protein KAG53_00835 [Endozoicomonadaceae bacterium]|nr:hypothetical protein [Endozoicomonadaceae bacterium]